MLEPNRNTPTHVEGPTAAGGSPLPWGHGPVPFPERCRRIRLRLLAQEHYGFHQAEAARLAFWRWLFVEKGGRRW